MLLVFLILENTKMLPFHGHYTASFRLSPSLSVLESPASVYAFTVQLTDEEWSCPMPNYYPMRYTSCLGHTRPLPTAGSSVCTSVMFIN